MLLYPEISSGLTTKLLIRVPWISLFPDFIWQGNPDENASSLFSILPSVICDIDWNAYVEATSNPVRDL